jgi:hypothetical protein
MPVVNYNEVKARRKADSARYHPYARKGKLDASEELSSGTRVPNPEDELLDPPPGPPPISLPDGAFYICCSDIQVVAAGYVESLTSTADIPLDEFVRSLRTGLLVLQAKPDANGQLLVGGSIPASHDEWADWMADSMNATQIQVIQRDTEKVSAFALQVSRPMTLTFSTDNFPASFISPPLLTQPRLGYVENCLMMVFGLEKPATSTTTCSLAQILDFLQLDHAFMLGLDSSILLQLEANDPKSVNAIWFEPTANYATTMRLQFSFVAATGTTDPLQQLIESYLKNLTISDAQLIARRSTFRSPVGDGASTYTVEGKSEVIVSATLADAKSGASFDAYLDFRGDVLSIYLLPPRGMGLTISGLIDVALACLPDSINQGDFDAFRQVVSLLDPTTSNGKFRIIRLEFGVMGTGVEKLEIVTEYDAQFGKQSTSTDSISILVR